jgi:hypothetical protein
MLNEKEKVLNNAEALCRPQVLLPTENCGFLLQLVQLRRCRRCRYNAQALSC